MDPSADADLQWRVLLEEQIELNRRSYSRMAYNILLDDSEAEDACQQAFLKAWQQRDRLRNKQMLRAWLTRVIINDCLILLRRRKTEKRVLEYQARSLSQGGIGPEKQLELRELTLASLNELEETTRSVVVLRIIEGYSGNEVKQMLDCSASEVSRRLHQGMEQLRMAILNHHRNGKMSP